MSIRNRQLIEGSTSVICESKFQTFLGKVYCVFAGHKKAQLKTGTIEKNYCICCWREME